MFKALPRFPSIRSPTKLRTSEGTLYIHRLDPAFNNVQYKNPNLYTTVLNAYDIE